MSVKRSCNWEEAYSFCRKSSGNRATLASIGSSAENSFVTSLLHGVHSSWLGGTYLRTNRWAWIDGNNWNEYNNWRRGEPNNAGGNNQYRREEKIMIYGGLGTWNDLSSKRIIGGFVCEYKY